jgi:outer membrane scaffolding protein for murein synthesis (MipA/OmpV family)
MACALGAAVAVSGAAWAQKPATDGKDWSLTVGAGALYAPDYEGSDDYEVRALPFLMASYQDWLTFSVPEGLRAAVVNVDGFKAGVLLAYRFDRDGDDNIALKRWGDVDGAIEAGLFAEYRSGPFRVEFDVQHDVSGAHEGMVAQLSARYGARIGPAMVSFGPQVTWADDNYTQTYFGITPAQAAVALVPYVPYAADGGIKDYGLSAMVVVPLSDSWSVTGLASVNVLTGDAADSPLVQAQGSETQFMAGLFLGYRF